MLALASCLLLAALAQPPADPYAAWQHHGTCWLLTDAHGATLPADAAVEDFPVLLRWAGKAFPFAQAQPGGKDLRFSDAAGAPLAYEIETWGEPGACVWVRVPRIVGNARQALHVHWGNPAAKAESNPRAVFGAFNGFAAVLHLGSEIADATGALTVRDTGTRPTAGMIGSARRLDGGAMLTAGDAIATFPKGAESSSTEAWFWAERANSTVVAWGKEQRPGKVMMNLRSPPHVSIDCYFADVRGKSRVPLREWLHVVHTYAKNDSRVYVNGVLDGASQPLLDIPSQGRFDVGGWHHPEFAGAIDEVRVSKVARTPAWIALGYANQRALQTLVGPLVTAGDGLAVANDTVDVREGEHAKVTVRAGGTQKLYWRRVRGEASEVVAVDVDEFTIAAGRVRGDTELTLRVIGVFPDRVEQRDVRVRVREAIADPEFELTAPATWDGRQRLTLAPRVTNRDALRAQGAAELRYVWRCAGIATVHDERAGQLVLERAQASGVLRVTLAVDNGGEPVQREVFLAVTEPASDPFVPQPLADDERPVDHQFFARDAEGKGLLAWRGEWPAGAERVFLRVLADGQPFAQTGAEPARRFDLQVTLRPGLVHYRAELGTETGGRTAIIATADDLICGDAFLVDGQSNAEATDLGPDDPPLSSEWVRSFGHLTDDAGRARTRVWGPAVARSREAGKLQIGYWALLLGMQLVEAQKVPVCILNGAVGGSRIDRHQRNPATPDDLATIYGRLLWRVRAARLTHGIRGLIWHQGENDQGADGPSGRWGYETWGDDFIAMAAGWRRDYPNLQHTYVFQIWPRACAMGRDGSDDLLREVQRTLPRHFARLHTMSTLGIDPPGGCHYPLAGYAEFARLLAPLFERDFHGKRFDRSITPPDLRSARFVDAQRDRIALEFDQPVVWQAALAEHFALDGARGQVAEASTTGNALILRLQKPTTARTITYVDGGHWRPGTVLRGENGIAALTFCRVPIE